MNSSTLGAAALACAAIGSPAFCAPDISPKILEVGKPANLTITLTESPVPIEELRVLYVRQDGADRNNNIDTYKWAFYDVIKPECSSESMTLKIPAFKMDMEGFATMVVAVNEQDASKPKDTWKQVGKFPIYALKSDLFSLRPFKGDFHTHSAESDGNGTSFSVYAYARRGGHDFMALTDHRKFKHSVPAKAKIDALQSGMLAMAGEEIHYDGTPLHAVSVSAKQGVCDWVLEHRAEAENLIAEKKKIIPRGELSEYDFNGVATAEMMFDRARDLGAKLVIYSHPYWCPNNRYDASTGYTDTMFARHMFDTVECPNMQSFEETMRIVADIRRLALTGYETSVVNVSDTHSAHNEDFLGNNSIVFCDELSIDKLCNAVKNRMSVAAVGDIEDKCGPLFVGRDRLVYFCYFLARNYYPQHDALCKEQGELMLKAIDGDNSDETKAKIVEIRKQIDQYNDQTWAK